MNRKLMMLSILLLGSMFADAFPNVGRIAFSVTVIDENTGLPIENIPVKAVFADIPTHWGDDSVGRVVKAITDSKGVCRFEGTSNHGTAFYSVETIPKYYATPVVGYKATNETSSVIPIPYRCEPYDCVFTTLLQRVEHPIPLCVRFAEKRNDKGRLGGFDGTNAVLQYDFIKGDWLPPEGEGTYADMTIRTHYDLREIVTNSVSVLYFYDFTNEIEFSGAGNGLYEESFKDKNCGIKIRVAPEDGYVSSKTLRFGSKKNIFGKGGVNMFMKYYKDSDEDRCYCFRIRSKFNNEGELTEAYYGKIYGDFNFKGHMQTGFNGVQFLYYLNPKPLDRNLEWDMKNNMANENAKSRRQRFYGEP